MTDQKAQVIQQFHKEINAYFHTDIPFNGSPAALQAFDTVFDMYASIEEMKTTLQLSDNDIYQMFRDNCLIQLITPDIKLYIVKKEILEDL